AASSNAPSRPAGRRAARKADLVATHDDGKFAPDARAGSGKENSVEFAAHQKTAAVLSHVEAVYRPGDRQLAIDLFEALGCRTCDTGTKSPAGSTYVSVHPDPDDRSH